MRPFLDLIIVINITIKYYVNNIKTNYILMYNKMNTTSRFGKRWTVNECLQLHREFELLNLSMDEIALRHKRTPNAIMFKLEQEGLADYNVLYSNYYDLNLHMSTNDFDDNSDDDSNNDSDDDSDDDSEDDEKLNYDDLKEHITRLEKQVSALTEMFMKQTKNGKSVFSLFS